MDIVTLFALWHWWDTGDSTLIKIVFLSYGVLLILGILGCWFFCRYDLFGTWHHFNM